MHCVRTCTDPSARANLGRVNSESTEPHIENPNPEARAYVERLRSIPTSFATALTAPLGQSDIDFTLASEQDKRIVVAVIAMSKKVCRLSYY